VPIWWDPPDEVGRGVPSRLMNAQSADAAMALVGFTVYSTGFTLNILTTSRLPRPSYQGSVPIPPKRLRAMREQAPKISLEFPDAVRVWNLEEDIDHLPSDDQIGKRNPIRKRTARPQGFDKPNRRFEEYWVYPHPSPGFFVIRGTWKAAGLAGEASVDAALIQGSIEPRNTRDE
jgi:hypothetical protein